MSLPGFLGESALAPVAGYRTAGRFQTRPHAVIAARMHAPAQWFWPCFRNCYDRCGGEGPYHTDMCFRFCYDICDWNPWVVF